MIRKKEGRKTYMSIEVFFSELGGRKGGELGEVSEHIDATVDAIVLHGYIHMVTFGTTTYPLD